MPPDPPPISTETSCTSPMCGKGSLHFKIPAPVSKTERSTYELVTFGRFLFYCSLLALCHSQLQPWFHKLYLVPGCSKQPLLEEKNNRYAYDECIFIDQQINRLQSWRQHFTVSLSMEYLKKIEAGLRGEWFVNSPLLHLDFSFLTQCSNFQIRKFSFFCDAYTKKVESEIPSSTFLIFNK